MNAIRWAGHEPSLPLVRPRYAPFLTAGRASGESEILCQIKPPAVRSGISGPVIDSNRRPMGLVCTPSPMGYMTRGDRRRPPGASCFVQPVEGSVRFQTNPSPACCLSRSVQRFLWEVNVWLLACRGPQVKSPISTGELGQWRGSRPR